MTTSLCAEHVYYVVQKDYVVHKIIVAIGFVEICFRWQRNGIALKC